LRVDDLQTRQDQPNLRVHGFETPGACGSSAPADAQ
jgi:hypothetical protein